MVTDPPYGLEFMGQDWDAPWRSDRGIGRTWDAGMSQPAFRDGARRLPRPSFERRANVRCRTFRRWRVSSRPCQCPRPAFPDLRAANRRAYQDWCARWAIECGRVLKPGGHLVAFGGTRTYHRMACAIEDAGFEIRDSLHWIYGQGFPKSLNVANAIVRSHAARAHAGEAEKWRDWGTGLKPAHEPILLARKPFDEGTVAANVLAHGTGALHIGACRIPCPDPARYHRNAPADRGHAASRTRRLRYCLTAGSASPAGRWPANLLLTHSPACTATCAPGCPVRELDQQAGIRRSGANPVRRHAAVFATVYGRFTGQRACTPARGAQAGSAARFFPVFRYQPKATTAERPRLPGIAHPTVKPLELMRWLVRLVTPPGGTVLDPFAGTGTTLHACLLERARGIAVELDPGYAALCKTRLSAIQPEGEHPDRK